MSGSSIRATLAVALVCGSASAAEGQQARDALQRGIEAYENAEFAQAVELLSRGLDPSAGTGDSLWVVGIHTLADALIEQGAASIADVWLRWALRLEPATPVDSINYPPAVTNAFLAARASIGDPTGGSAEAAASWEWGETPGGPDQGMLRVLGGDTPVTAEVQGVGTVAAGSDTSLPAGTYQITATAVDHLPADIAAEVLPGITTVLNFALQPSMGLLYVVSRPWGEVFLDDERIGYTIIAAQRVEAGIHRLRIVREGYVPIDTTITISGAQPLRLGPFMLRPRTP